MAFDRRRRWVGLQDERAHHGRSWRCLIAPRTAPASARLSRACQILPKPPSMNAMGTMNVSLPDALKDFVDKQVRQRGYGTSSEYVRELIRKDQDRESMRRLLLEGAASPPSAKADKRYFAGLRNGIRRRPRR